MKSIHKAKGKLFGKRQPDLNMASSASLDFLSRNLTIQRLEEYCGFSKSVPCGSHPSRRRHTVPRIETIITGTQHLHEITGSVLTRIGGYRSRYQRRFRFEQYSGGGPCERDKKGFHGHAPASKRIEFIVLDCMIAIPSGRWKRRCEVHRCVAHSTGCHDGGNI
jgi:hypothetical protein